MTKYSMDVFGRIIQTEEDGTQVIGKPPVYTPPVPQVASRSPEPHKEGGAKKGGCGCWQR